MAPISESSSRSRSPRPSQTNPSRPCPGESGFNNNNTTTSSSTSAPEDAGPSSQRPSPEKEEGPDIVEEGDDSSDSQGPTGQDLLDSIERERPRHEASRNGHPAEPRGVQHPRLLGSSSGEEERRGEDSESEYEEGESSSIEDLDVYDIKCRQCSRELTRRGMRVYLCANPDERLYSTDIPMPNMRRGVPMSLDSCACMAEKVQCASCEEVVGYHITRPCEDCGSLEHNGHYWLFLDAHVIGDCRGIHWSDLPYNGAEESVEESGGAADTGSHSTPEARAEGPQRCPICLSSQLWKPTRLRGCCGHLFCYGCISREVDARGCCPVDRLPITREMLEVIDDA